ncbi:hypothetical protein [uncultured Thermanaerothrix sp.]|uniref:hypothetical protein n=1 Tax=uncultured Thermanaerothrix sp. TaxID=1195149 RepID=UPI002637FA81|nr:hypothetical protein [uncultured Thermanaerothrix sp.]
MAFEGLLAFGLTSLLFLVIQRWLHHEMQAFFYLLTGRPNWAIALFSIFLFPGVFLHEASHALMAWLLRVPVQGVSLLPRLLPNGQLELGAVRTTPADFLRDALIGAAPFFTGALLVAHLGLNILDFKLLIPLFLQAEWRALFQQALTLTQQPDFWLWFYLTFAISSTMIPSAADRRAWWGVATILGAVVLIAFLAGMGQWLALTLWPFLNRGFLTLGLILGIALTVHLALALPLWALNRLIAHARRALLA